MRARQQQSRFCRNLNEGIDHLSQAIQRFRTARNNTRRAADRRRLLRNIERLQSIRQDKRRLRRQRCS